MLVQDVMQRPVITAAPDTSLIDAYNTMRDREIRHLPILEDERLVGVITDRDMRYATRPPQDEQAYARTTIEEIMTRDPLTAGPLDPIEEAARIMRSEKIGCLPVLNGDDLVGIVTITNLLDSIIQLTGLEKPGGRLAVSLDDRPGQLAKLTTRIADEGYDVRSVLSYHETEEGELGSDADPDAPSTQFRVILRLDTINVRSLARRLRDEGFEVVWPTADRN